jgi:outer membrane protein OmpA-like peptidoglycan-associated protein
MFSGCTGSTSSLRPTPSEIGAAEPPAEKANVRGVEFARTRALRASAKPLLDAVAALLKTQPNAKVYIDAYCDQTGGRKVNQQLSKRRAAVVKDYLVKDGVASDRLIARGFGATNFIASNATADGRKQNRRIELLLL